MLYIVVLPMILTDAFHSISQAKVLSGLEEKLLLAWFGQSKSKTDQLR